MEILVKLRKDVLIGKRQDDFGLQSSNFWSSKKVDDVQVMTNKITARYDFIYISNK